MDSSSSLTTTVTATATMRSASLSAHSLLLRISLLLSGTGRSFRDHWMLHSKTADACEPYPSGQPIDESTIKSAENVSLHQDLALSRNTLRKHCQEFRTFRDRPSFRGLGFDFSEATWLKAIPIDQDHNETFFRKSINKYLEEEDIQIGERYCQQILHLCVQG
jgi:hypothetical protein